MKQTEPRQESTAVLLKVDPRQIAYLNAILESYEGLAMMRTLDPQEGIVSISLSLSPPHSSDSRDLLLSLQEELKFEFMESDDRARTL